MVIASGECGWICCGLHRACYGKEGGSPVETSPHVRDTSYVFNAHGSALDIAHASETLRERGCGETDQTDPRVGEQVRHRMVFWAAWNQRENGPTGGGGSGITQPMTG